MLPTDAHIEAARELGRTVPEYGRYALSGSTTQARGMMTTIAMKAMGVAHDPGDGAVDILADAYWEGVREAPECPVCGSPVVMVGYPPGPACSKALDAAYAGLSEDR